MSGPAGKFGAGARRLEPGDFLAQASIVLAAALVLILYCLRAWALVQYPWDWSPDEGLFLEQARRLLEAPALLYSRGFVPFPATYGPLFSAVLAPALVLPWGALATARVLALGWTLLGAGACFVLVRRETRAVVALAAAALALTPFDLTFWHVLLRPDGLQQTLWLLAATALLPRTLTRSGDRLSAPRLALGTLLVLAAALTKPTALLLCAPLVLGWFLVDRRSGLRLCLLLALAGLLVLAVLQWATAGGFLWVQQVWGMHAWRPDLPLAITGRFVASAWSVLLLCGVGALAAKGRIAEKATDGAVLLVLGGLTMLPLTAKFGAWWHYLLPLLTAVVILGARLWGRRGRPLGRIPPATAAAGAFAFLALALAVTRVFPLPTATDRSTAAALYGFIAHHTQETGGPILAIRPELAYFVVHQPVEMEGSCYADLARSGAPGTELIHQRLRRAAYSAVVVAWPWQLPAEDVRAAAASYHVAGACVLGYFWGPSVVTVLVRNDSASALSVPAGARCGPSTADALAVRSR